MIQELLGSSSGFISSSGGDRKISIINTQSVLAPSLPSSSVTTASTTTTSGGGIGAAPANATSSNSENLRCPRCDSSNTKFCYYNNYNLTQPRHFCKTCRRYWTKGGALRNVPIGGGCRKNKSVTGALSSSSSSNSVASKTSTALAMMGKMKSPVSGLGGGANGCFDHHQEVPASPILWGSPQNSHILALLRANPNPSSSPNVNPIPNKGMSMKEDGNLMMRSHSHMVSEQIMGSNNNGLMSNNNVPPTSSFDPSLGLTSSLWRNNNHHLGNGGFVFGVEHHQNSGIQELYHRLRSSSSSANNYCSDDSSTSMFQGIMASSSLASSSASSVAILESTPANNNGSSNGIGLGYWNSQPLFWSDLPTTTNGAHP